MAHCPRRLLAGHDAPESNDMKRANPMDRLQRIRLLKECLKVANDDLLECVALDPLSIASHMASMTAREISEELQALETGAVLESLS
jgi:hypothetical protein